MTETYYTIKQLADIAGTSKVTMFRYIKQNSIHETKHKGNANLYDETQKSLILKGFKGKGVSNVSETAHDETELIQELKSQLKAKDAQINDLHAIIKQNQRLLDQQQQLNLATNRQNEKLLDGGANDTQQNVSESQNIDDTDDLQLNEGNPKSEDTETPKKGLFGWLKRR
ncbi:helix-turn-helix domain-containing protein [Lactiplantibacillus plantarum]|uniref:helix-turn-helix domain-containing protein n=1 Tax=Lactiplantibacillus plantarum TaxID=1590 RepID=UPI002043E67A|nr:helix-turn-helix domain-containing protein [Lactiplantibacillus plantarum]MCM2629887.1 helix-turn-helix domain-containing protein [Lactiplantibacillus plantarum]